MGLQPFDYWDFGFESRWGNGCFSLVSVVCCHVEVSVLAGYSSRGVLPSVVCLSVVLNPR